MILSHKAVSGFSLSPYPAVLTSTSCGPQHSTPATLKFHQMRSPQNIFSRDAAFSAGQTQQFPFDQGTLQPDTPQVLVAQSPLIGFHVRIAPER